jgi:CheY-like chemotaxis protein
MEHPLRVLVCGNRDLRVQLSEVLRAQASVVETSSRDEALAAMETSSFDAAFIDIDRSEPNGFNIAARLRRTTSTRRIRLIAVSSVQRSSDLAAFREAGFDLRVAWPIKQDQILAAVHSIRIPGSDK